MKKRYDIYIYMFLVVSLILNFYNSKNIEAELKTTEFYNISVIDEDINRKTTINKATIKRETEENLFLKLPDGNNIQLTKNNKKIKKEKVLNEEEILNIKTKYYARILLFWLYLLLIILLFLRKTKKS